jgi:hypothetical protein
MITISMAIDALLNPVRFWNVTAKQDTKFVHIKSNLFLHVSSLDLSAISSNSGSLIRDSTTNKLKYNNDKTKQPNETP